jgi:hypothetical protein
MGGIISECPGDFIGIGSPSPKMGGTLPAAIREMFQSDVGSPQARFANLYLDHQPPIEWDNTMIKAAANISAKQKPRMRPRPRGEWPRLLESVINVVPQRGGGVRPSKLLENATRGLVNRTRKLR